MVAARRRTARALTRRGADERAPLPLDDETVARLVRAAEQAQVAAPSGAAQVLRRVLDTLPHDHPRRAGYVAKLVTAELFAGRLRIAEALARDALEGGGADLAAHAAIANGLGQSLLLQGRLTEAGAVFGTAQSRNDTALDPAALADTAMTQMMAGDLAPAADTAERALIVARAASDAVAEVAALAVLCSVLGLRGEIPAALSCGRAAASRADNCGVVEAHWNMPNLFLASALQWADQVDECRDAIERAGTIGRRLSLGWDEPIRLATLADLQFRMGEWDEVVASAEAGLRRSLDRGAGLADIWSHCVLARIHLHRGDLDLATEEAGRAERLANEGSTGIERVALVHALCAEAGGDLDAASSTIQALWAAFDQRGVAVKLLDLCCDAMRIARRTGNRAFGSTIVETTRQLANRCSDTAAPALLARCRGLMDDDPDLLQRAAKMLRLRRRPVEEAFARWEAATIYAARGDDRARWTFAAAGQLLERIKARPLPIDERWPGRERPASARFGWSALSQAERNVVELVAGGLSNAAIAERLICSRRTVESHLHHVYTKLGMSSRVALAVEARQRMSA
jgi:ATP/maltotriose-dependent transcriptional regulator MalT